MAKAGVSWPMAGQEVGLKGVEFVYIRGVCKERLLLGNEWENERVRYRLGNCVLSNQELCRVKV